MFKDRTEAGKLLAEKLKSYKGKDCIILAIPRGGVVVAYEIAKELNAPLDLIIPRKIGAPYNPELAIGAVAQDGSLFLDENLIKDLQISDSYIESTVKDELEEINRRMKKYRGDKPYPSLKNKTIVLVDDGIATGSTMRATIAFVRKQKPSSIIVAVPVGPYDTIELLKREVDKIICLDTPEPFYAIGMFYHNFEQTTDEEVIALLQKSKK